MKKNSDADHKPVKLNRPMGMWVLILYTFIFTGILPFLITIYSILSKSNETNLFYIILSILLSLFIIFTSIGTWQGKEIARKLLLLTLTLYYIVLGINNYFLIKSGLFTAEEVKSLWSQVFLGLIVLVINWIYFNLSWVKEFFKPKANQLEG